MRVAFISDLHAHNFSAFAKTLPGGRNSRFQNILNVLQEFRQFCVDNAVDLVFFLGDMFHSRTKVDVDVFSATWREWQRISEVVEHVYILAGNHDQYTQRGSVHSLEAFSSFATVVDKPILEKVGRLKFAMHPFTTDIAEWRAFRDMLPDGLDFFLFHQGICEAKTGAFDIMVKAEINLSDVPTDKARWCISGHYHKHQWLNDQTAYVGSPLQHNFGEREETKGFLLFEDPRSKPAFRESTAPRFRLYDLLDDDAFSQFWAIQHDVDLPLVDEFVRVRVARDIHAQQVKEKFPHFQVEIIPKVSEERPRIKQSALGSDEELLKEYVELVAAGFDKKKLLRIGLELMEETG